MTLVEVILILVSLMVAVLLSAATMLVLLRRSVQISTRHRVAVPTRWILTPSRAAHAHRRLRGAVSMMRDACPAPRRGRESGPLTELADEVEALAVSLDRDVLDASRQPLAQRLPRISALSDRISQVEGLTAAVARMSLAGDPTRSTPAQWQERLTQTEMRIGALGDAQREVEALERQLGLQ